MNDAGLLASCDVAVVGGGIAGLCTAFELRNRGFDVVLVEQRFPSFGASGRNSGAIWLQTRRAGAELDLARAGKHKYAEYIEELGNVFEYRCLGGLFFYENDQQGQVLEDYVTDRRKAGLDVEMLTPAQAAEYSQYVPTSAIGAIYCPDDAQIDSNQFVIALAAACIRKGISVFENTAVLSTIRDGDNAVGLRTVRGDVRASGVVWATGAWASGLRAEGIILPVKTARMGQLITQPIGARAGAVLHGPRGVRGCPALTSLPSYQREYFTHPGARGTAIDYDDALTISRGGSLVIGSSIDGYGSLNPHISVAATQSMVSTTIDRFGELQQVGVTGLWAGLMSETPDGMPIVDRVDGTFVNVGHAWGLSSAPICGQILAELIAGETSSFSEVVSAGRASLEHSHLTEESERSL